MKGIYKLSLLMVFIFSVNLLSQTFDGEWQIDYVTEDDAGNGTGQRTLAVTALEENTFVALVSRESANAYYIVGYKNADSTSGRLGVYPYGSDANDYRTRWIVGFFQVDFERTRGIASHNGIIYVTNNDPDHYILTFEMTNDTVISHNARLSTGTQKDIWAIDIDDAGRVYVTQEGDSTNPGAVLIYDNLDNESAWANGSVGTPLQTIQLPEPGSARGIAVNEDGSVIYVSNHYSKNVYCYVGNPTDGYTLYNGFNFSVDTTFIASDTSTVVVGPWGMRYMRGNNLLFIAHDADFQRGMAYEYGRIYIVDPNTGLVLDTINVAEWNKSVTGSYNNYINWKASGYASVYSVDFDNNKNVYSQSYYAWTVDKWKYTGTLPVIDLTITSVEKLENELPQKFELAQNYPNPFNPTTTIQFSLPKSSTITLEVYNVTGELVSELIKNASFNAGVYKISFDASNLASGTYIYKLSNGNYTISKKMILMK